MTQEIRKNVAVLGSTGSVGEQALDVADRLSMNVTSISAHRNYKRVEEQARKFGVRSVAMADPNAAKELKTRLADTEIHVYSGAEGICEMIAEEKRDVVLNSIIGEAGLLPTLAVIESGARLALANKESLVVAGELVMKKAKEKGVEILPVDSEHCAIHQCLKSGNSKEVKRILLTASGGPFFGFTKEKLRTMGVSDALAHPTWSMGAKITIDSATLMNKGFEVIEAVHLFGVSAEQIRVVVHRESIIHSMVEYIDNSVIAQMSVPDMRHCVQYALSYPERCEATTEELDLFSRGNLTFAKPDTDTFILLGKAFEVITKGGALPAVLNAVNEEIVSAFLNGKIAFYQIPELVCESVEKYAFSSNVKDLKDILKIASESRKLANSLISLK